MNISKHDQKFILILLSLLVLFLSYFSVSKSLHGKEAAVQTELDALAPQYQELRSYYDNLTSYKQQATEMADSVNQSMSEFPSDVRSEDMVMYSTELAEKVGITVDSISMDSPEVVSQFTIPKMTGDSIETVPYTVISVKFTVSCGLNYQQLKSLISYVYDNSKKTTLDSLVISYDSETGNLLGNVTLNKYFILSSDYIYTPTGTPSVTKGITDPFGTFTTPAVPNVATN